MDAGPLGLGAVAWNEAWHAALPEQVLRLPVDPARLLDLLRDVPASRALLADLQRAAPTGRSVELIVSADRQVAEIATGTSRHVLTVAARNVLLSALLRPSQADPTRALGQSGTVASQVQVQGAAARPADAAGVLWRSPGTEPHTPGPLPTLSLPWLGAQARLEVEPDHQHQAPADGQPDGRVVSATLRLEFANLGRFNARIRVCGSTVAVSIECEEPRVLEPRLVALARSLADQGLVTAHVGAVSVAAAGAVPT